MNKKMREILASIEAKTKEARGYMDGENKDVEKAAAILDEVAQLKKEYETEKRLYEMEKEESAPEEKDVKEKKIKRSKEEALEEFGKAAKGGFKKDLTGILNEGSDPDGGYTVPEDIRAQVIEFREAEFSFLDLVRREVVRTASGARTFKKRSQYTGFNKVGEGGKIGATATPKFDRLTWSIDKYAGYMPITNELRYDSDANVGRFVVDWLANESRATANKLILAQINSNVPVSGAVDLESLDGIKKALNVDLSLFKRSAKVITNDDGLQYLDTLKESSDSNKYLLTPDPTKPMQMRLSVGATTVPLIVVPNQIMPTPTDGDTAGQIPFIIGDLFEGVVYWDRQWMSIAESGVASIGDLNAFEQDLTLYRAIEREDVTLRDKESFIVGYINPSGE